MQRILLIRNDILGLKLQDSCLRRHQVTIRVAASEQEALAMAITQPVDLVVMDRESSGMTVAEFCTAYRALPGSLQGALVLLEDNPESATARSFLDAGGRAVIARSMEPEALGAEIAKLLGIPARGATRVPVQVLVKMELPDVATPFKSMFANTVDMSVTGVRIEAQHPLSADTNVRMHMVLPGASERLTLRAVVRHVVDETLMHYGLEFTDLTGEARDIIDAFLRRRGAA